MTGAEHTTAPVIAFLDDDAVADPRWLEERGWTAEMSAYVTTQDPNHLVASGNAKPDLEDFDVSVHIVDFGRWHGYPVYWKVTPDELNKLISQYCAQGAISKKPLLLEEFGCVLESGGRR
jgi:mannan endo-1,4-beta-mannosidase